MELPLGEMVQSLLSLSGHVLDLYKYKKDGTFAEQQQLVAALQQQDREQIAAHAAEVESMQSDTRIREGGLFRQLDLQVEVGRTNIDLHRQLVARRLQREDERALFRNNDPETVRQSVVEITMGGSRPALLIAPFHRDDLTTEQNQTAIPSFRMNIRRQWITKPWSEDLGCLDGALARPLSDTDADVLAIRRVLADLPVVLIYGDIQSQQRVWASIVAWNIAEIEDGPSINLNLGPIRMPQGQDPTLRIEFEDTLGDMMSMAAAIFAEWFHVLRQGRVPRFHEHFRNGYLNLARAGAVYAVAYDVAIRRGQLSEVVGRIHQADMFAAAELPDKAVEAARRAVELAESCLDIVPVREMRRLCALLVEAGDGHKAKEAGLLLKRKTAAVINDFR
ncbi:hypothetical protein ACFQO7_33210 [Catellatospora aurea]|uniref:Uncharacterized protein n=1 Tax=Catellatospora aurea TaxID=1337874 RepID=A0ABW2H7N8_9ACTN